MDIDGDRRRCIFAFAHRAVDALDFVGAAIIGAQDLALQQRVVRVLGAEGPLAACPGLTVVQRMLDGEHAELCDPRVKARVLVLVGVPGVSATYIKERFPDVIRDGGWIAIGTEPDGPALQLAVGAPGDGRVATGLVRAPDAQGGLTYVDVAVTAECMSGRAEATD